MVKCINNSKIRNKALSSMTVSKIFRQFFTPQKYSQIMIENLDIDTPEKILDLSMGEGSLWLKQWRYGKIVNL